VSPVSVTQVLACHTFGGTESVVQALARGLRRRHHETRVVAVLDLEPWPHPFVQQLDSAGIEVVPLRLRPRAYRTERRELARILQGLRPDVVHTHGYRADLQAGSVARKMAIPIVSTVHGFTGGDFRMRLYEWLQERSLRRFDGVIAVSRPLYDRLRLKGMPDARLHRIPNAWEPSGTLLSREQARRELGLVPEAFVVGWAGRLSGEKGADVLIDALAQLRDDAVSCCVIGEGPERASLEARVASLSLAQRVRWAGARPAAGLLFRAFDALVLSSRTEGTPIVLFEAMGAGVPIVATRVGGVPDVVGPDEAWLVEPDAPEPLAGALAELRTQPALAASRVARSQRRLEREFGVGPWLTAHESLYASLRRDPASEPGPADRRT
jgi:glycosyltransferase involved in cell wall biosynthesis